MKDILQNATAENARAVMTAMNVIQSEHDQREHRDVLTLNMNNSDALSRLSESEKLKMMFLTAHSIADNESGIEKVTLCNAGIEDKLAVQLLTVLAERSHSLSVSELSLESNRIGDDGMDALCGLIRCNVPSLITIKLWNNKKDVTTNCCNRMVDALESNDKIIKFVFDWRIRHHKDRAEKVLRRNQDLRRNARVKIV